VIPLSAFVEMDTVPPFIKHGGNEIRKDFRINVSVLPQFVQVGSEFKSVVTGKRYLEMQQN